MQPTSKLQVMISLILQLGILLSTVLVFIGGAMYLFQHGQAGLATELLQASIYQTNLNQIWHDALSFSPLGIIELGLIALVLTQVLRIALLTSFYAFIRDYWFTLFTLMILCLLLYSLIWGK